MHLYFWARGISHQIELWKILMQGHFWRMPIKDTITGVEREILVQGALRTSVLGAWEYVFPEKCLPEVLQILGLRGEDDLGVADKTYAKVRLAATRKIFGAEKIPKEAWEELKTLPQDGTLVKGRYRGLSNSIVPGVSIHPIGIKRDETSLFQTTQQEML